MRFLLLVISLLVFSVTPVLAADTEVLTDNEKIIFPPVTAGPGFLLPDSPFYSLDKIYQRIRLALIFTSENRAQLHNQIAGERLAELRVMVSRNNSEGVDKALMELTQESRLAAKELNDALAQGKDVKKLAQAINQSITLQRETLTAVANQAGETSFAQRLHATVDTLFDAKLLAEESLPEEEQENEIARSVDEELERAILGVTTSTSKLEKKLSNYEKQASKAAEKKSELELKKAKNAKELREAKAKLEKLKLEKQKRIEEVRKVVNEAREAAKKFREAEKAEREAARKATITPTVTPTTSL